MTWDEVRAKYPDQWVLMEAFEAYTENGKRIIPKMVVLGAHGADWWSVWKQYKVMKELAPDREHFFYHTSNTVMNIEIRMSGIRV
jgi:hypothetical protein